MKKITLLIAVLTLLISCNNSKKEYVAPKEVPLSERPIPALPGTAGASANNVIGGAHYICPNNCVGGSGSDAGSCPVCATAMAHNQGYHNSPNPNSANNTSTPATTAANSVIGGAHYICPNNCIGGSGANAGNCPVCETAMAHNQGYHTGQNTNTPATPTTTNTTPTATGPNASGQYHYTCSNGCAGGADGAGTCSICGGDLAHNAAYHS